MLWRNNFQHDNVPVHKRESMKLLFAKVGVEELKWLIGTPNAVHHHQCLTSLSLVTELTDSHSHTPKSETFPEDCKL